MSTLAVHLALLERRLAPLQRKWFDAARAEVGAGCSDDRFCQLFSQASRYAPRQPLAPNADERAEAERALGGWNPERWSTLEALRVALVLSHPGVAGEGVVRALREAFKYADVGETCALYKSLAHLPAPERFVWQAGEGARSSMRVVFESACCDTPYPAKCFDDTAWRQAVIKCMFIEAPMWRVWGLDTRLDAELARMALDLVEERRSAGRPISPELWMCLGAHAGPRGLAHIEHELREGAPRGRAGAGLALVRAGHRDRLQAQLALEEDPLVRQVFADALSGQATCRAWAALDPALPTAAGAR
jgi:hypothetical protein